MTMLPAVDPAMGTPPPDRVTVVGPNSVAVDEGALARAIGVVLDRRDRDNGLRAQMRSDPYPTVLSAEPRV